MSLFTATQQPETNSGTITSWLPLTTPFPYNLNGACSLGSWAPSGNGPDRDSIALAFDPDSNYANKFASNCLPTEVTKWWNQRATTGGDDLMTQYLIGPIICPEIYTTAMTSELGGGTTQVACCPSNYTFVSILPPSSIGECTSPVSVGQVVTYVMGPLLNATTMADAWFIAGAPVNGMNFGTMPTSSSMPAENLTAAATITPIPTLTPSHSFGPGSSSRNSSTTPKTTQPLVTADTPTTFTSQDPSRTTIFQVPTAPVTSSTTLPVRTIIGISVCGSLAVIGINAAVITWFVRRYRRRKAARETVAQNKDEAQASTSLVELRRELSGADQRFEIDSDERKFELSSNRPPVHELVVHEEAQELSS